jgi:hypothetical protein
MPIELKEEDILHINNYVDSVIRKNGLEEKDIDKDFSSARGGELDIVILRLCCVAFVIVVVYAIAK